MYEYILDILYNINRIQIDDQNSDAIKKWDESPEFESYMNKIKTLCDDTKMRTMKGVFSIKGNIARTP